MSDGGLFSSSNFGSPALPNPGSSDSRNEGDRPIVTGADVADDDVDIFTPRFAVPASNLAKRCAFAASIHDLRRDAHERSHSPVHHHTVMAYTALLIRTCRACQCKIGCCHSPLETMRLQETRWRQRISEFYVA